MFAVRGIYLAVMAVPLFCSVTLLLFLKVDLLTKDVSASENAVSYVGHVLKMQQALENINVDLNVANGKFPEMSSENLLKFGCKEINAIKMLPPSSDSDNPISRRMGVHGLSMVQVVRSIARNCKSDKSTEGICLILASYQILKEAATFLQLRHPALPRVLGICSSIERNDATYITETGPPVNITFLKTLSFTRRLQIVFHVVSLISHLHNSDLGHLSLRSVNNGTFAWINGFVKFADISQLTTDNTACSRHSDCLFEGSSAGVKCYKGICAGLQSQVILQKTMEFFKPLFKEIHQKSEQERMQHIVTQIEHLNIDATEAARQIKGLLDSISAQQPNGQSEQQTVMINSNKSHSFSSEMENWKNKDTLYWSGGPDEYKFQRRKDMNMASGQHDYACPRSLISWGCQLRVNTVTQALTRCTGDPQCRAFVLTENDYQMGTLTVVLKSGVGDMRVKEGSSVYVKVPLGTDSLHLIHEDDFPVNYQNENPASCLAGISSGTKKALEQRHAALMKLLNIHGLTEAEWLESVKYDRITAVTLVEDEMKSRHTSLRVQVEIDGVGRSAILILGERPSSSLFSHLLFYHLDRILGMYRVVPSAFRLLDSQELQQMSRLQPKLRTKLQSALLGNTTAHVVVTPELEGISVSTKPLSLRPLSQQPTGMDPLSQHEKSQLEYLLLLWLSGTPRDQTYTSANGEALHFLNMDGFQQGVDSLLPYFNHCQFPQSMVEFLQALSNTTSNACSLSSQLMYQLRLDGVEEKDLLGGFHSIKHPMLLVDKAAEKLLEIISKCVQVFGRKIVLY